METPLTIEQVSQRIGVSKSTIKRLRAKDSRFPAPMKIGVSIRWRTADIDRYLRECQIDAAA